MCSIMSYLKCQCTSYNTHPIIQYNKLISFSVFLKISHKASLCLLSAWVLLGLHGLPDSWNTDIKSFGSFGLETKKKTNVTVVYLQAMQQEMFFWEFIKMDDLPNFDIHVISGVELLLLTDAGVSSGQQLWSAEPCGESLGWDQRCVVMTTAVIKTHCCLDINVPKLATLFRTAAWQLVETESWNSNRDIQYWNITCPFKFS